MIILPQPVQKPYIFGTKKIVGIQVLLTPRPNGRAIFSFSIIDEFGKTIPYDRGIVPGPSIEEISAMIAIPTQAGDTMEQDQHRRALSWVKTGPLGLVDAAVQ